MIHKMAEKIVGEQRQVRKTWFSQICENALQRRKQAREIGLRDIQNEEFSYLFIFLIFFFLFLSFFSYLFLFFFI